MMRATLFLLILLLSAAFGFAQEQEPQEKSPIGQTDEIVPNADGHVEKDPDELGAELPFESKQKTPDEHLKVLSTSINPEINSNAPPTNFTDTALLRGLNKITARTSKLEVKLGDSIKFGNLKITLHACWKSPPEEDMENKALLEMWEEIPGEPRSKIFKGWMFSSSPLISSPEHPVYDITLLACTGHMLKNVKNPADSKAPKAEGQPSPKH